MSREYFVESTERYEARDLNHLDLYQSLFHSGKSLTESAFEPGLDATFSSAFMLPTWFADASATVIATAGLPRCVLLLDNDHWRAISAMLLGSDTSQDSPAKAALQSLILGSAVEITISASGTIELPDHLLKYAEIDWKMTAFRHGAAIELVRAGAPRPLE